MQVGLPHAMVMLGSVVVLGCGGAMRGAVPPEDGLPLLPTPGTSAAPTRAEDEPEPTPPDPGGATGRCPLHWTPREMHASVFTLAADLHGRMMAPLIRAICTCTRQGQRIAVVARLVPEHGEVTAQTVDRPDGEARSSRSIDACLAHELGAGRYEPFRVGSDLVWDCPPVTPTARMPGQPAHLPALRRVECRPEEEKFTIISYPLYVDRRDER